MIINYLRSKVSQPHIWPEIDYELNDYKGHLNGMVLNAGAGSRDISHLVSGKLINQDIKWVNENRTHIQDYSPLHQIPFEDEYFDAIVCIAVLEHVDNPVDIVKEFFRVLKPGGVVIASVPFLQPEHKIPTDYQRYTKDGLHNLFYKKSLK